MRVLFCNIPFRENYMGEEEAIDGEPISYECYNFYEVDNYYYGYCNNGEDIDLDKFKNILVVWVSNKRIVGWYKNAQVYNKCISKKIFTTKRCEMVYNIKAKAKDCILIKSLNRIPFTLTFSCILLLDLDKDSKEASIDKVLDYIKNYKGESLNKVMTDKDLLEVTNIKYEALQDYLIKGEELYGEYKDFEALTYFNKAIELDGDSAIGLNGRGLALTSLNKYSLAIFSLNKALLIDPLMEEAMYNKGSAYSAKGEFKKGINCFKAALKLNPHFDDTYIKIAFLYKGIGEDILAKEYLHKAIKLNKNNDVYNQII